MTTLVSDWADPHSTWPQIRAGMCPPPLYATPRSPDRPTTGATIDLISRLCGWPMMPHQRLIADVAGERLPNGEPAYRTIIVLLQRQNAKTTTAFCNAIEVLARTAEPGIYTAQSGEAARRKLVDHWAPILNPSPLNERRKPISHMVRKVTEGVGAVTIGLRGGGVLFLGSSREESGHGGTNTIAILDEGWVELGADSRETALLPTVAVPKQAQLWIISVAGDDDSVWLRGKRDLGREIAGAPDGGVNSGLAFFEWAAPEDVDDWRSLRWAGIGNPALGRTIRPATLRQAQQVMGELAYRRSWLGQWGGRRIEGAINEAVWRGCERTVVDLTGNVAIAVDGPWDGSAATLLAADESGRAMVIRHAAGTRWVPDAAAEWLDSWRDAGGNRARVAVLSGGPVSHLVHDLREARLRVEEVTPMEYRAACARVWRDVHGSGDDQRVIRCAEDRGMQVAVYGAVRKQMLSLTGWVWRPVTEDIDISPLVALTLGSDLAVRARSGRSRIMMPPT